MEYEEEEENGYNTSDIDWGGDEYEFEGEISENQMLSEGETDVDAIGHNYRQEETGFEESWQQDVSSESYCEEKQGRQGITPETPEHYQYNTSCYNETWAGDESSYGVYNEEQSYGNSNRRHLKTTKTQEKKFHHYGIVSSHVPTQSAPTCLKTQTNLRCNYASNPLVFTGCSKDPEVYLRWETNMKQWLRSHNIPKEEKLGYALSMLEGEAYKWWVKEDAATYYTSKPILDWGTLKSRMYREFTKKYQTTTRTVKSTQNMQPPREQKSIHCADSKTMSLDMLTRRTEVKKSIREGEIQQKSIPTPLQQEPLQGKSESINPLELMCYKCKQQGHIAKDCPTKRKAKVDDPLTRTSQASACGGNPKSPIQELKSGCESLLTNLERLKHFLLSKEVQESLGTKTTPHTRIETTKEDQVGKEVNPNPMVPTHEDEVLRQPEQKLSVITPHEAPKQDSSLELQVSVQSNSIETVQCLSNTCESNSVITHLSFQESFKVVSGATKGETTQPMEKCEDDTRNELKEVVKNQESCETYLCDSQAKTKQKEQVASKLLSSDHNFQNTCLMHFSTAKDLEKDVGAKEKLDSTVTEPNTLDRLQNLQDVASNPMNDHEDHSGEPQEVSNDYYLLNMDQNNEPNVKLHTMNKEEESLDAHRTLEIDSSTKRGIISSPNDMVQVKTCQYDLNTSMTVLTHLSSAKNVEKVSGPKETNTTLKEEGNRNNEECKLLPTKPSTNRDEIVGDTVQIKEKPPDDKPNHKSRGKLLNPYTLQWIDLNYLCVGEQKLDQVLRAKLFEERGYDEVIKSSLNNGQEERRSSLEEGQASLQTLGLRAVNKSDRTTEACSGQTDHQLNGHSSTTTWDKFLAHLGRSSKWNHSILSPHEEDMNFTFLIVSSNPELDVCALFGWPRSDQKELGCKLNCYAILTHERSSEIWNHANPSPYEEVINFSRQGILNGPNLEASDSRSFQTFVWRPGELLQPLEDPKRFKDFPFDPGISLAF